MMIFDDRITSVLIFQIPIMLQKLSITFIILFTISTLFPIIASIINKEGAVMNAGYYDVGIALLCFVIFVLLAMRIKQTNANIATRSQKIIQYIATAPLILICLYFIKVDINWQILLIGLGWRFWLLVMAVPYLVEGLGGDER
jgi:hypothetical protein